MTILYSKYFSSIIRLISILYRNNAAKIAEFVDMSVKTLLSVRPDTTAFK